MSLRAVALGLALTVAAVLPAAGGGGQAGETRTLRVDLYADVPFIDPAYDSSLRYFSSGWQISRVAGLKLLDFPDTGGAAGSTLRPQAATAMPKVSKDGKTYTFTIRKGLRFSNGERVTAASFDRAIERALAGGPLAKRFAGDIVSSQPVGQSQLRVRLKAPSADFLARLTMPFFSAVPVKTPLSLQEKPIPTAGPYYVKLWDIANQTIQLERNQFYGGNRKRNFESIELKYGQPLDTGYTRCETGQSDVCAVPTRAANEIASKYGENRGRYFIRKSMVMDYVAFNHKRPLFENNAGLRKAVNFAIDRATLSRGFLGGTTDQILPPGMPGYRDANIYPDTPDLARANALAQGNLRGGKAELWVPATFTSIGAVVKFNLAQIGIDVTVKGIDPSTYGTAIRKRGEPFDMAINAWAGDYPDPYDFINVLLEGKRIYDANNNNNNVGFFDDPSFNRTMERAARLSGLARSNAYAQLDADLMKAAAPIAPYLQRNNRLLLSSKVGCFDYHFWYGTQLGSLCPN